MYTEYNELPVSSKVWVYTADSLLSDEEVFALQKQLQLFCDKWEAHKEPVKAWGGVLHNLFLVLIADEGFHAVSGCSIDSSVHFVRETGKSIGVDFFDRKNVALFKSEKWEIMPQTKVVEQIISGQILPEDRVFNYRISDKSNLEQNFSVAISESWLSRYIPQVV